MPSEKITRRVLLILTIANILPLLILTLATVPVPIDEAGFELFVLVLCGLVTFIVVLWLARSVKTLNGVFVALLVCCALLLSAGLISGIARGAFDATFSYIIGLDGDIAFLVRIFLLYIGYYVLAGIAAFAVLITVAWVLALVVIAISVAIPIHIYKRYMPESMKDGMHHVAYVVAVALMLGTIGLFVSVIIRYM